MPASPFVADWVSRLAPADRPPQRARALDLAMGLGRHARLMARHGFLAFGVDVQFDAVRGAVAAAALEGLSVLGWCADLTVYPLPVAAFDLIVVTRYLQRDLFPSMRGALRPGGHVVYETFTVNQRALGRGPRSAAHLLEAGELAACFAGWDVIFNEETERPEALARLVARKPRSRD